MQIKPLDNKHPLALARRAEATNVMKKSDIGKPRRGDAQALARRARLEIIARLREMSCTPSSIASLRVGDEYLYMSDAECAKVLDFLEEETEMRNL